MTVTAEALTRKVIEAEIAQRMARYKRMPVHWEARRITEMKSIEALVDRRLALALEHGVTVDRAGKRSA